MLYPASGREAAPLGEVPCVRLRSLLTAVAVLAGLAAVPTLAAPAAAEDLTALVNPLAGSLGPGFITVAPAALRDGHARRGTTTPEGDDPVNYVGYGYQDPEVRGFAITHFSGAGIHIGGELPFMPTTGAVTRATRPSGLAPAARHETAHPGYYRVDLAALPDHAELTATRGSRSSATPSRPTTQANLLLDVSRDNDNRAEPVPCRSSMTAPSWQRHPPGQRRRHDLLHRPLRPAVHLTRHLARVDAHAGRHRRERRRRGRLGHLRHDEQSRRWRAGRACRTPTRPAQTTTSTPRHRTARRSTPCRRGETGVERPAARHRRDRRRKQASGDVLHRTSTTHS